MNIVYRPLIQAIIHEVVYLEKDQLIFAMGHGAEAGNFGRSLYWAEGIAFAYSVLPWGDQTIADFINGNIHVNSLVFAKWPDFTPMHEIPNSKIRIPLWDVSTQEFGSTIAKFCKERIPK